MPRKGRGGKVAGNAQTAYSNRTDLNNRGPEPVTTAPGQAYGQAKAQEDAQRAVPMAGTATPQAQATRAPAPEMPQVQQMEPGQLPWLEPPQAHEQALNGAIKTARPLNVNPPDKSRERIADALSEAASHPYATQMIQELAALAKQAKV